MQIITNHQYRPIVSFYDLSAKQQRENEGRENESFFIYKNWAYCLADFMRTEYLAPMHIDGVFPETAFSGIGIKFSKDNERVIVYGVYS